MGPQPQVKKTPTPTHSTPIAHAWRARGEPRTSGAPSSRATRRRSTRPGSSPTPTTGWAATRRIRSALGRWYFKVPRLFGGSKDLAEQHLRASLTYNPASTASHFFLAELLLGDGRNNEARAELRQVLDAPLDPDWAPEDQEFKAGARSLLATP